MVGRGSDDLKEYKEWAVTIILIGKKLGSIQPGEKRIISINQPKFGKVKIEEEKMISKHEFLQLKKKEQLLKKSAEILRVEEKDLPRIIERFLREIEEMKNSTS